MPSKRGACLINLLRRVRDLVFRSHLRVGKAIKYARQTVNYYDGGSGVRSQGIDEACTLLCNSQSRLVPHRRRALCEIHQLCIETTPSPVRSATINLSLLKSYPFSLMSI